MQKIAHTVEIGYHIDSKMSTQPTEKKKLIFVATETGCHGGPGEIVMAQGVTRKRFLSRISTEEN